MLAENRPDDQMSDGGADDDGRLLEGVRVLDLAKLIPGARRGGALAALGADVVRVEQPAGTYLRRVPPLVHGLSLLSATLDAGKRSVGLDVEHPRCRLRCCGVSPRRPT